MKNVYIITTYTGTALSYLIRNISKVEYAHVSISLNRELSPMYSFGRINPKTPIFAGLVQENINEGLYAIKQNTVCRVYSLSVSNLSYELIKGTLDEMWNERRRYAYDVVALVRMPICRAKARDYRYVCSTFVAHVLEKGDITLFNKEYHWVTPNDFLQSTNLKLEYEGLLSEYNAHCVLKGTMD